MSDDLSGDMLAPSWPNLVMFVMEYSNLCVVNSLHNTNNEHYHSIGFLLIRDYVPQSAEF